MPPSPRHLSSDPELEDIFLRYSSDDETLSIQQLTWIARDFAFPVSPRQIDSFFGEQKDCDSTDVGDANINFIEFSQFVRHQETTVKRLFTTVFDDLEDSQTVSCDDIRARIGCFKTKYAPLHYYWNIDADFWVSIVFKRANRRKDSGDDTAPLTYRDFRRQALLHSTPSLRRVYRTQSVAQKYQEFAKKHKLREARKSKRSAEELKQLSAADRTNVLLSDAVAVLSEAVTDLEIKLIFENLSGGKGYIDMRQLFNAVKKSRMPVSEHQLAQFFYRCDVNEDGRIDLIEFSQFMREEETAIRQLFDNVDLDASGKLNAAEIKAAIHRATFDQRQSPKRKGKKTDEEKEEEEEEVVDRDTDSESMTLSSKSGKFDLSEAEKEAELERLSESDSGSELQRQWLRSERAPVGLSESEIDLWVDTVIQRLSQEGRGDRSTVSWNDFRKYAILSGSRNLLNIVHPFKPSTFFDFIEIEDVWVELDTETRGEALVLRDLVAAKRRRLKNALAFCSGLVAGAVSRTCTAPMDRVKIAMQAEGKSKGGLEHYFRAMFSEGGLRSFWRGNGVNVLKMAPETACKFTTYRMVRQKMEARLGAEFVGTHQFATNLLCGACAGVVSQTMIYPLEIVKTRMALGNTGQYRSPYHCFRLLVKHQGVGAVYNGWMPSVAGIVPYAAIEMGTFFTLNAKYEEYNNGEKAPHMFVLGMAGLANVLGSSVAYPFQVVRTKLQAQQMPGRTPQKAYYSFKGPVDCVRQTLIHDGWRGLYSGLLPNFMKSIPATCISYWTFNQTKEFLYGRFLD